MVQIIVIAAVAFFLFWRLKSVLGSRQGFENPKQNTNNKSNPANKILIVKKELEGNINLMNKAMQSFVKLKLEKFSSIVGEMNSLSPLNVLSRGYSISKNKKTDKIIRSKKDVNLGDVISTKASEISFESKVTKTD